MALTYELGKIANWDEVCNIVAVADEPMRGIKAGDRVQNPVTTSLIYATMAVGLGEITEENCEQFYGRLAVYEKLFGAFMYRPQGHEGPEALTAEEVIQHIGLRTNVGPETDAKWAKRITTHALSDERQHFGRAKRRLEEAAQKPIEVHKIA
ncbi:hypothetical protein EHM76_07310 [bacterium]|nr:MAG: hypothetical protein EHM76_07310 [bacterium]